MEAVNLNRLAYFAAVVESGSFTSAADRLGITKTVVSQQVARLEVELKTALLMRTTRRVEPTEAGRLFYARSVVILREAEDAVREIALSNTEPNGVLRIAAPNDYGAAAIAPAAVAFSKRYPSCQLDLILSDARMDPIANQVDLSIRVGWLDDSSLHAKRIGAFRQMLVAAPTLAKTLDIRHIDDLRSAPFVANGALKDPLSWHFARGDFEHHIIQMSQILAINTTPAVLSATLAGGGVSILPDYLVGRHIETGHLVPLLQDWMLPAGGIYVVYPTARFRPPKVTSFVEMLVSAEAARVDLAGTNSPRFA